MLAAQISRFGGPDVIELREVPRPHPVRDQVEVRVEAASVNGHDTLVRSGGLRLVTGARFPIGIGLDFVGTISRTGDDVHGHAVGERVWGMVHPQRKHATGSAAEHVVVTADRIATAPGSLEPAAAVALVVAGTTAVTALDVLALQPGSSLLIRGAAGGVGSAAVQLAHARDVRVVAIAGDRHADAVRRLGADEVLDRQDADPARVGTFDGILDTAGTDLRAWRRALGERGRIVTVALSGRVILASAASAIHGGRRIRTFSANPRSAVLSSLADAADAAAVVPVVASTRPLADIQEAHRAFDRGGALGKHVLTVAAGAA